MHYRKIWEEHHNVKIPNGYEIHHKDGNRKNNNIDNLVCVSIEEHLEIHMKQEDWGAVQAILARMDNKQEISKYASFAQKERYKNGKHNFQKISKDERTRISKNTIENRIKNGHGAFLGISDITENSRNAGLVAAKKQAGFLNTNSENHGSKHVKDSCWWTDKKGNHKRSKQKPEGEWIKGMKWQ